MRVKKKNKKIKSQGITCKLAIDRFFEECRTKFHIYAFQNESKKKIEFLNGIGLPYIITTLPKRVYFAYGSSNRLVDEGFTMLFANLTKEQVLAVRQVIFNYFKNSFQIRWPIDDLRNKPDNEILSGKFMLQNLKIKEERA